MDHLTDKSTKKSDVDKAYIDRVVHLISEIEAEARTVGDSQIVTNLESDSQFFERLNARKSKADLDSASAITQ